MASGTTIVEFLSAAICLSVSNLCCIVPPLSKYVSDFGRLVLGCIDSYDSEKRRILQLFFSRSTRFAFLCTFGIPNGKTYLEENLAENPKEENETTRPQRKVEN